MQEGGCINIAKQCVQDTFSSFLGELFSVHSGAVCGEKGKN